MQTQSAIPINLIKPVNGQKLKTFQEKLQTAVISIATTGIISCTGFLWKVNASQARVEEHIMEMDKNINNLQLNVNNMQLDVRDIRDRIIKLETLKNK
jgi:predicted  nucleic acid-binding Zn-ribbon protein